MAVEESNWEVFYDNLSGALLDTGLVREARKEEMEEAYKHGVYEKVSVQECYEKTGKAPIGTRWVGVDKGDSASIVQIQIGGAGNKHGKARILVCGDATSGGQESTHVHGGDKVSGIGEADGMRE